MGRILPFSSVQAAELIDADEKRLMNAKAQALLLGGVLRRHVDADGRVTLSIGLHKFDSIESAEDFIDQLRGDAE